MRTEVPRYRADFDHESESVSWQAPDGRLFLVSGTDQGFALRAPEDWESDEEVEFEADAWGAVFFRGEPVGWTIPSAVLRRAS